MKTLQFACYLLFALSTLAPLTVYGQAEEGPARIAEQLLEAISTRDTTLFRQLMAPEAILASTRMRDGIPDYRTSTVDQNVAMLAAEGPQFLERMWNPEVQVDGQVASVWTRYDFYVDGDFSHCGTDAFQLVLTENGWKIISLIYTIEPDRTQCPESPLGPAH